MNIGIVLIAHVIDLRHAGMPRHEAILQAGHDRLRPIMMTTLTTLLGMLPLAIGDAQVGGGGEGPAYHPLARAIIGGLAFSAIVSLIIVPIFYVWFDDLNLWRKRVFTREQPAVEVPSPARRRQSPESEAGARRASGPAGSPHQGAVDFPVFVEQDVGRHAPRACARRRPARWNSGSAPFRPGCDRRRSCAGDRTAP